MTTKVSPHPSGDTGRKLKAQKAVSSPQGDGERAQAAAPSANSEIAKEPAKNHTARLSRQDRRKQLLDIGAALFAESSYGGVTTAAIAKAAGVTEPVLYQHFASKEVLYQEVLREACRRTLENWEASMKVAASPLAGLVNVCRGQFRAMSELWVYYKLHVRAIAEASDATVRTLLCENDERYHQFFTAALKKAQGAGEIREQVVVSDVAWFIMSQGLMLNVCKQIGNTKIEESGYIENLIASTLSGVSVGLRPDASVVGNLVGGRPNNR